MDTSAIKREVVQSDMMKIFLAVVSIFTFLLVVKVYFTLNGQKNEEWYSSIYPYIVVSNKAGVTLKHFWVIATHMIIESSFMALFANFMWLWLFGFTLEQLRGRNTVLPIYIVAGLVCAIVVLIATAAKANALQMNFYFGMRNSVIAVAAAAVWANPTYKVFQMFNGGFSIWILGVVFLLLNLVTVGRFDLANCLALIVAILIGITYQAIFNGMVVKVSDLLSRVYVNKGNSSLKFTKAMVNKSFTIKEVSEQKLNTILDKISESGMESLTPNEQAWLKSFKEKE